MSVQHESPLSFSRQIPVAKAGDFFLSESRVKETYRDVPLHAFRTNESSSMFRASLLGAHY
ncbi:hypothetical protein J2S03_003338 [Alicyclobacillus cycloheptanicus]|uniref:Uncharacterized protein n=1 Tax=Alicyclobacillus cycloheptanicus TaxID=1457 RepID=A0ABT9XME8_9BACL|nr:hypothetical protein [Alicyclobacillus cycloheptanicus]